MNRYSSARTASLLLIVLLMSACTFTNNNNAGPSGGVFTLGNTTISAEVLLPESYYSEPKKIYPVLYVLDAYWTKESIQKSYKDLLFDNQVPELIHVSIGYPDTIKSFETQRMNDLTPEFDSVFQQGGRAKQLLQLLNEQLLPYIENNFRTDPQHRILTGHSLAALFTLYTMYTSTHSFTHYAANSPSALWANEALIEIDRQYALKNSSLDTNLYITYGTEEYAPYVAALKKYMAQLLGQNYSDLNLTLDSIEGLRHAGMSTQGFLRGILWAFSENPPEGVSQFEAMHEPE